MNFCLLGEREIEMEDGRYLMEWRWKEEETEIAEGMEIER
jgi:hypothetical protein